MSKVLHIESSPRKTRSHSISVTTEFLQVYKANHPDDEIETLDIWGMDLPVFDGHMFDAKYAVINGEDPSDEQAAAWATVQGVFDHFNSADLYVISVPMWNFGIPYRLKQYVDVITQPGMAWSYTAEESYKGLMKDKSAVVIYSSGDGYGEGTGFEAYDLQKPYINLWLNFIGITDIQTINVEATLFADRNSKEVAKAEALSMASSF